MKSKLLNTAEYLYKKLIAPRSEHPDARRREFILNVLLVGLSSTAIIGFVTSVVHTFAENVFHNDGSVVATGLFLLVVLFLFWLSRHGYYQPISFVLVGLVGLVGLYCMLGWSFVLPMVQLIFAFMIVLAGVLFRASIALLMSLIVSLIFLVIAYAQVHGYLNPDTSWFNFPLDMADAIGGAVLFIIIGVITWLANREIDNSLDRARTSEAALAVERDSLEIKVVERTRELEQAQMVRVMELQRFAEFGRLSAGLLHEMANPLTVASLNLEQLSDKHQPALVRRAIESLHHIERYVEAARKQLKSQGNLVDFAVQKEIRQIITMLKHRARESQVRIILLPGENLGRIKLFGDPVKFSQLIANLLLNSIEAYDNLPDVETRRQISVSVVRQDKGLQVSVHDWGHGLNAEEKKRIFEPFYSTKPKEERNMGIGLAMVKQIAINDFNGRVKVTSSPKNGTKFSVYIRSQKKA